MRGRPLYFAWILSFSNAVEAQRLLQELVIDIRTTDECLWNHGHLPKIAGGITQGAKDDATILNVYQIMEILDVERN